MSPSSCINFVNSDPNWINDSVAACPDHNIPEGEDVGEKEEEEGEEINVRLLEVTIPFSKSFSVDFLTGEISDEMGFMLIELGDNEVLPCRV